MRQPDDPGSGGSLHPEPHVPADPELRRLLVVIWLGGFASGVMIGAAGAVGLILLT